MPGRRSTAVAPIWVAPDAARSVHFVGDAHVDVSISALQQRVVSDLAAMTAITRVQVGDLTDNGADHSAGGFAAHDALAKAYLAQFDMPFELGLGNHDVFQNGRTVADWETAYATQRNRVVDAGPFLLVFIAPDVMVEAGTPIVIPTATVNWLDAQLAAATKPCIVVCHAPLFTTVLGARSSTVADYYVTVDQPPDLGGTDTALRTVLGNHASAFAFASGHTHSNPIWNGSFVKREQVGSRYIACINVSAIAYVWADPQSTGDPIRTVLVTVPASGDRVETRIRDHTLLKWVPCSYGLVATVLL